MHHQLSLKKKIPVERIVEKIIDRPVPVPVDRIVEKPVEKIVYVDKPYPIEKIIDRPVEKIVYVDKPVPVYKDKIIEKIVDRPVEKVVYVNRPVPVEKLIYVDKPYPVEKIIEKEDTRRINELTDELNRLSNLLRQRDNEVAHHKEGHEQAKKALANVKPVEKIVEKIVDRPVPVPYERIVEKPVEKIVYVDKPYPVDRIVEKIVEVPVEVVVEKIIDRPVFIDRPVPIYQEKLVIEKQQPVQMRESMRNISQPVLRPPEITERTNFREGDKRVIGENVVMGKQYPAGPIGPGYIQTGPMRGPLQNIGDYSQSFKENIPMNQMPGGGFVDERQLKQRPTYPGYQRVNSEPMYIVDPMMDGGYDNRRQQQPPQGGWIQERGDPRQFQKGGYVEEMDPRSTASMRLGKNADPRMSGASRDSRDLVDPRMSGANRDSRDLVDPRMSGPNRDSRDLVVDGLRSEPLSVGRKM